MPPAVETWSLNHWTIREVPHISAFITHAKAPAQDNFTVPKQDSLKIIMVCGSLKNIVKPDHVSLIILI